MKMTTGVLKMKDVFIFFVLEFIPNTEAYHQADGKKNEKEIETRKTKILSVEKSDKDVNNLCWNLFN